HHKTAFHVTYTWTGGDFVAKFLIWPFIDGPCRPYGVEVSENRHLACSAKKLPSDDKIAARIVRDPVNLEPHIGEAFRHNSPDGIHALFVVGTAVDVDQLFEQ